MTRRLFKTRFKSIRGMLPVSAVQSSVIRDFDFYFVFYVSKNKEKKDEIFLVKIQFSHLLRANLGAILADG